MLIGLNLARPTYFGTAWEFSDLTVPGSGWYNQPAGTPQPPILGTLPAVGQMFPDDYFFMRAGTYILECQGHGTLRVSCADLPGGYRDFSFPGGPYAFDLAGKSGLAVTIVANAGYSGGQLADPRAALKNMHIYGPGSAPSQRFQPAYLDSLDGFGCLRGMDWQQTNAETVSQWGHLTPFAQLDVPGLVELANATGIDLWLCIPMRAYSPGGPTDYCGNLGAYLAANLDPSLTAYLEYANEVWNPTFAAQKYVTQIYPSLTDPSTGAVVKLNGWPGGYACMATRCYDAVAAEIDPAKGPTIRRVLAGQAGNWNGSVYGAQWYCQHYGWAYDLVSCAPYAAWPNKGAYTNAAIAALVASGGDAVGLLCEGVRSEMTLIPTPMAAWTKAVATYGKPMVYYEMGIDCTGLWSNKATAPAMQAAMGDPRWGQVVTDYLTLIAGFNPTLGNWYNHCGATWGALRNIDDTGNTVWQALQAAKAGPMPPAPVPAPVGA